jgi:hypothetical protein
MREFIAFLAASKSALKAGVFNNEWANWRAKIRSASEL